MTLLQQLNRLPPPLVRLLCHPLTDEQISERSGLSSITVLRISRQGDWAKQLEDISAFLEVCGINVRVTLPDLRKVKRIMNSKRGLAGVISVNRRNIPLWRKAQQVAQLKRLINTMPV